MPKLEREKSSEHDLSGGISEAFGAFLINDSEKTSSAHTSRDSVMKIACSTIMYFLPTTLFPGANGLATTAQTVFSLAMKGLLMASGVAHSLLFLISQIWRILWNDYLSNGSNVQRHNQCGFRSIASPIASSILIRTSATGRQCIQSDVHIHIGSRVAHTRR